jgi:hypothetical protein
MNGQETLWVQRGVPRRPIGGAMMALLAFRLLSDSLNGEVRIERASLVGRVHRRIGYLLFIV